MARAICRRIVLNPYDEDTGSLTFQIYNVPADATGTIAIGGPPVTLKTTARGQNGVLTFSGTQGQRIYVKMTNRTFAGCPRVGILNPEGNGLLGSECVNSGDFFDTTALSHGAVTTPRARA